MSGDLPTPRSTKRAGFEVLVWCKAGCGHQAFADLQQIIDAGRGDVPLIHLRYRCTNCGSARTDWVVHTRSAVSVRPWRSSAT